MKFIETVNVCRGSHPARFAPHDGDGAKQIKGCAPFPRLPSPLETSDNGFPIFSPRSTREFFPNRGFRSRSTPFEIVELEKRKEEDCVFIHASSRGVQGRGRKRNATQCVCRLEKNEGEISMKGFQFLFISRKGGGGGGLQFLCSNVTRSF